MNVWRASNDDEPSLGWTERGPDALAPDADFFPDAELDDADDEEGGDLEPALGTE